MSEAPPPSPAPAEETDRPAPHPALKIALELGPLILFFIVFSKWGIFVATGVFMVTSVISLVVTWRREHRVPPMPLVTAVLVLVLGGLTIWLQNETFIKLKVTVINGLFGTTLLVGMLMRKHLIKHLLGEAIQLADAGWMTLSRMWMTYFFALAAINEVVWRNTSTETWVKFKTFGVLGLTFLFIIAQSPVLAKYDQSERETHTEP